MRTLLALFVLAAPCLAQTISAPLPLIQGSTPVITMSGIAPGKPATLFIWYPTALSGGIEEPAAQWHIAYANGEGVVKYRPPIPTGDVSYALMSHKAEPDWDECIARPVIPLRPITIIRHLVGIFLPSFLDNGPTESDEQDRRGDR